MGHGHDKKSIAELCLGMDIGRWQRQKSVQIDKKKWLDGGVVDSGYTTPHSEERGPMLTSKQLKALIQRCRHWTTSTQPY